MIGLQFTSVVSFFRRGGLIAFCTAATVLILSSRTVSAQSSLRKYVYGNTPSTKSKKPAAPKKAPKKPVAKASASVKKKKAAVATSKKPAAAAASRRTTTRPGWIKVTFESKEPNTQVYLNGNHVGTTDEKRVLRKSITPGVYRVKGSSGTSIVFPERLVQLGTDKMNVLLQEQVAVATVVEKKEEPIVIQKTQAEREIEIAREMSAKVIKTFSDFMDPLRSADVTTEDWRFASNAAVLGEFQNLSKQQIEAQRRFAAGQVHLAEGNRQKAFNDFNSAVQNFPSSPLPHVGLGDAYFASAQWQDAKRVYEQARSVGPNFWMAHLRLGDIYRILGDKKKAVLAYADAIKFGDNRYETRFLRVRALVDDEQVAAAIPLLEELLKEKPNSMVYLALGEAYELQKREVAALDNYRKAVELDPNLPVAQYRLARIYYEQREYQKAVDGFDAALKLDGDRRSFPHEDARSKRLNASGRVRTGSK